MSTSSLQPSDKALKKATTALLRSNHIDLNNVTINLLRSSLESQFGCDLNDRKDVIKSATTKFVEEIKKSVEEDEEVDDDDDLNALLDEDDGFAGIPKHGLSDDEDEEQEDGKEKAIEEEEDYEPRRSRVKKEKTEKKQGMYEMRRCEEIKNTLIYIS